MLVIKLHIIIKTRAKKKKTARSFVKKMMCFESIDNIIIKECVQDLIKLSHTERIV